jgi:hypothetical protein
MRRTERFGGKPLIVGKSNCAKRMLKHATDRPTRSESRFCEMTEV